MDLLLCVPYVGHECIGQRDVRMLEREIVPLHTMVM